MADNALPLPPVTGWVLAGGEARRMQGRDKGLEPYRGRPLAEWAATCLTEQCQSVHISANRNLSTYADLLRKHASHQNRQHEPTRPESVDPTPAALACSTQIHPDDPDLPAASGPLAGILTALRHAPSDWVLIVPCDTPHLPPDLVSRLMQQALQHDTDVLTPYTHAPQHPIQYHWACALIHKRIRVRTEAQFASGERRLRAWAQAQRWQGVSFDDPLAFTNFNTLETLHDRP